MNLLVGATGFIGGHVVEYLFEQAEISKGMFRKGAHLKIMDNNGVQGLEADLLDHHTLHEAVEGTDTIYNMASATPFEDKDFDKVNTEGVANILEVAKEMKVKTFVHLSCVDVYGFAGKEVSQDSQPKPENPYQKFKLEADRLLLEHSKTGQDPRIVIIRAARALGSRDPSLAVPLLRMIEANKVTVPDSKTMSFSHPRDIGSAMYKAATNPAVKSGVYLLKSFDCSAEDAAKSLVSGLALTAEVKKEGMFSKSQLPPYTQQQLRAGLHIGDQASWGDLGFKPEYGLQRTCEEIAKWYKRDPWATQAA